MGRFEDKKTNKSVWLFAVLLFCSFVFAVAQCFYSPVSNDEAFYLTIPQRLLSGDALLVDEWHLSQLSSVLLLPIVFLYKLIVPTQQGVILAFRFIYLFLHTVIAIFLYIKLRKYGVGAIFASIAYFLYTPVFIPALSYNTMGLGALVVVCALAVDYDKTKHPNSVAVVIGAGFSCAILCSPFLVLGYVLYTIAVIIIKFVNKTEEKISAKVISVKAWMLVSLGCFIVFTAFMALLFAQGTFNKLFECIPHILNDPEHQGMVLFPFIRFVVGLLYRHKIAIVLLVGGILGLSAGIFLLVKDKNRASHRGIYLTIVSVPVILANIVLSVVANNIGYIMVAINAVGILAFVFTKEKKWQWLIVFWTIGIVYAYCMFTSSNTGLSAISQGLSVATLGSILAIGDCLKEMKHEKATKPFVIVLLLVLVMQPVCQIVSQEIKCFQGRQEFVVYDFGCKFGILDDKATVEAERKYYEDIEPILQEENKSVLYFSYKIWPYMCGENEMGSYSGWLAGVNENSYARLVEYYKINPEKIPDFIYLDAYYPWVNENYQRVADELGYHVEQGNCGYLLRKR